MSHVVEIKTEVRDPDALRAACRRLGVPEPALGTFQLYSAAASGLGVRLPGWHYPIVFDVKRAEAHFDNFRGYWGKQQELDKLLQAYAIEKAKIEARRKGYNTTEQQLTDGSIKLTVQIEGGTA